MESFELICHHKYNSFGGIPVDVSGCESHGRAIATSLLRDGIAPGSGALTINTPGRVHIPVTRVWQKLVGLKIEITVRLQPVSGTALPRVLVRGLDSFAFFCFKSKLIGTYTKPQPIFPGAKTEGITAMVVPFDQWVTLGFFHNGLDVMELYRDEQLVARRTDVPEGVPGVGPEGVFIGAGGNYVSHELQGAVDEVKVWRLNPYIVDTAFYSRPLEDSVADCWDDYFRRLAAWFARYPECAQEIRQTIDDVLGGFRRAVVTHGPETRERFNRTTREYLKLWRAGKLDSPEMEQLFADWCAWLRLIGMSLEHDSDVHALRHSKCLKQALAECQPPDCDPELSGLLQRIIRHCAGHRTATSA